MEPINSGGESTGRLVAIPPDPNQALALDKLRLHRARKAARMEGEVRTDGRPDWSEGLVTGPTSPNGHTWPDQPARAEALRLLEIHRQRKAGLDPLGAPAEQRMFARKHPDDDPVPEPAAETPRRRTLVDALHEGWLGLQQNLEGALAMLTATEADRLERAEDGRILYAPIGPGGRPVIIEYSPEEKAARSEQLQQDIAEHVGQVARLERERADIPRSRVTERVLSGQSRNPIDYFRAAIDLAASSGPQALPAIVASGLGAAVGGPAGAAIGGGVASAPMEYTASFLESLRQQGVDLTDEAAVERALDDPAVVRQAREYAATRAAIIAAVDAVSGGAIGKVAKSRIFSNLSRAGRAGVMGGEALAESGAEGGGEALAQLATDGQVDAREVAAEVLGGLGGQAPATVGAINLGVRGFQERRARQRSDAGEELPAPRMTVEEREEFTRAAQEAPIDQVQQAIDAGRLTVEQTEIAREIIGERRGASVPSDARSQGDDPSAGFVSDRVSAVSASASSSESGTPLKSSSAILPPSTQSEPPQNSEMSPPSGVSRMRHTSPLNEENRGSGSAISTTESDAFDAATPSPSGGAGGVYDPADPTQARPTRFQPDAGAERTNRGMENPLPAEGRSDVFGAGDGTSFPHRGTDSDGGFGESRAKDVSTPIDDADVQTTRPEAPAQGETPTSSIAGNTRRGADGSPSEGRFLGLQNADIDVLREEHGLAPVTAARRKSWEESLTRAREKGLVDQADDLAAGIIANPRALNDEEHMAMAERQAQLMDQYENLQQEISQATEQGDEARLVELRQRSEATLERLDTVSRAGRAAGTEVGRWMAARKARFDRDRYRAGEIALRARAAKGGTLKATERQRIETLSQEIEDARQKVEQLEKENEELRWKEAEERAQREIARQAKKRTRTEKIKADRADIKTQLAKLGYRVNDAVGLTAEAAVLVGRLARTYIAEGVTNLPDLIRRVQGDVDGLDARDVVDVLAGRFSEPKARSDAEKRVAELRSQASLISKIEDALDGIGDVTSPVAEKGKRKEPSAVVRDLRQTLGELTESLLRDRSDQERLARTLEKIESIRALIDQGLPENRQRAKRRADPETIRKAKQELADLRRLADIAARIKDLDEQLSTGEFKTPAIVTRREEPQALRAARARLKQKQREVDRAIEALRPRKLLSKENVLDVLELPRNLLASGDIGALGRQGIFHVLNPLNIAKTGRSAAAMWKALRSQAKADEIQAGLLNPTDPQLQAMARLREQAGLAIKSLDDERFRDRETVVRNNLIERLNAARRLQGKDPRKALHFLEGYLSASERNMVVGLNVLRAELFDPMARAYMKGEISIEDLKAWAQYINVTTGHGDLAGLGRAADSLNRFFFSPRLLISRVQTPVTLAATAKRNAAFAKQVGNDIGGMLAGAGTVFFLAGLAGADIEWDPDDGDFLKLVIGNTRIDFLGGYAQSVRLGLGLARTTALAKVFGAGTENRFREDPYALIGTYLKYKLAPGITAATMLATQRDMLGEEIGTGEALVRSVTPILLQEAVDSFQQEGALWAFGALGLSMIGTGVSTYDDPLAHQHVEPYLRRAEYRPSAPNVDGATPEQKEEFKKAFEERFAQAIRKDRDRLEGLDTDVLRTELQNMAADARWAVEMEVSDAR